MVKGLLIQKKKSLRKKVKTALTASAVAFIACAVNPYNAYSWSIDTDISYSNFNGSELYSDKVEKAYISGNLSYSGNSLVFSFNNSVIVPINHGANVTIFGTYGLETLAFSDCVFGVKSYYNDSRSQFAIANDNLKKIVIKNISFEEADNNKGQIGRFNLTYNNDKLAELEISDLQATDYFSRYNVPFKFFTFGELNSLITNIDSSVELRLGGKINGNGLGDNINGKFVFANAAMESLTGASIGVWNADDAQKITVSNIDVVGKTIFYSDSWKNYNGNLSFRPYDFYNGAITAFVHDDDENLFEIHEFNQNTVITDSAEEGGTGANFIFLGYTLDEKAYYMAMHEDILRFQDGSQEILIDIADGGSGGFFGSKLYLGDYNVPINSDEVRRWESEHGGDNKSDLDYSLAKDNIFKNRVYVTPDQVATIYYDLTINKVNDGDKVLTADYKLHRININRGKNFSLIGNIGSASEYISLDNGFTGEGGLNLVAETNEDGNTVDTDIYLGGSANSYTGATIVNSDVTLHLENADSISASKALVLYGNASFVVGDGTASTGKEFTNFDKVTLVGTSSTGADGATQTQVNGGGSTIKLDGKGKQFSFFQEDSLHPDGPTMAANSDPANYPVTYSSLLTHHTVNVTNTTVDISNGAAMLVNYLGKTIGGNLDPTTQDNMHDLAILALGKDANVVVDGYDANSETSAHLYLGNGIIRLDDSSSSLTLSGGAAIHLSAHRDGMFEYPYDDKGNDIADLVDDHKHASIELNGGTLNLELDAQSHLYSDHILSADHKHYLMGAAQVDSDGNAITKPVTVADSVTFCLTEDAINNLKEEIPDVITADWANEKHITMEQAQQLQTIYKNEGGKYDALLGAIENTAAPSTITELKSEFVKAGGNPDDFNNLLSTLVTLGMNNEVHGFMFQKYGVQFTDDGAYMYVLETLSVEDFINQTGIQVSIKNEVNETLDIITSGKEQDYVNSGAFEIINNVLDTVTADQNYDETVAAARTLDSAAQLATVAGTQTLAWDMLQTRSDSTQRHLDSIKNLPANKLHLWADFLYMHNNSHSMWTDVNGEREVQADLGGFIAGGDYRYNENAVAGVSFSFMGGTAETTLGKTYSLDISNDVYGLAGSVYAQYDFAPGWRVRGDVAYQYTNNEAEMTFPALYNISDKLTADVGTNAVQALVAVEKDVNLTDSVVLTPYIGAKYTYLRTDGYTSKLGSKDAFTTDTAEQHIVSVPVGVKVSKEIELKNGKKVTPRAGIYVQPNFGDTEVKNHVQGAGFKSSDTIYPEVIGTFSFGGHVGAEMELNDKFSVALDYNYNGSDKSNNHNVTASIVFKF